MVGESPANGAAMFAGFANVWTIVGLARDLRVGSLLPIRVAGERVVAFRDAAGNARALIDRCPHRGVALSLGKLRDGVIECPFHGWRFDGTGANCTVPWNPDAKRAGLGATMLPLRELGGLLWLHTGANPVSEPLPSDTLALPDIVLAAQSTLWSTHWTRAMENMLDVPHLPFVHARTIGRALGGRMGSPMEVTWSPTPYGARISGEIEGRDRATRLDYRFPNAMELFIDRPGRIMRMLAVCTPEDERTTRLTIVIMRNFARSRLFDPLFRLANRRIAHEDQAIVESSDPVEVPPAAQEKSVRTDKPTLGFRKIYFERIKPGRAR